MKTVYFLILVLVLISCSDDIAVVEPNESNADNSLLKLLPVKIDLQGGFEGQSIYIKIDSLIYYNALLSELVPLAGPQSSFKTFLEEGIHKIYFIGSQLDGTNNTRIDSAKLEISDSEKYYVGLNIHNDSLYIKIQNIPFMYL